MSAAGFDSLPAKNNWMTEVMKLLSSILVYVTDPPVLLTYFVVGAVFHVKPCGQCGQLSKHLDMACQVTNDGLFIDRVMWYFIIRKGGSVFITSPVK